jgi:hypothetical protein
MATTLVQSDWDDPTHVSAGLAAQIANKKRTAGANSGKTIKEVEFSRGTYDNLASPPVAGANLAAVRIVFTDGTQEVNLFAANVMFTNPGQVDTLAHTMS